MAIISINIKSALLQLICTPLYKANCNEYNSSRPDQNGNICFLQKPRIGMAILTITPTFFCCLFTANYWRKVEVGVQKIWTLPLLLMQLYLPFSDLRFAYQILQNDQSVIAVKQNYDRTMTTIGMNP